jgi:hypothetical protein
MNAPAPAPAQGPVPPAPAPAPPAPAPAPVQPPPPAPGAVQPPVPVNPRLNRQPRSHVDGFVPAQADGIPDLLREVANQPFHTVTDRQPSTWIPAFLSMFAVLHQMDTLLADNYYFARGSPLWHPFISRLYISVLVHVHILRVLDSQGLVPMDYHSFVRDFVSTFNLDNLIIPGPLVPFFETLTAFASPELWLGNIHPTLPEMRLPFHAEDINHLMPSPLLMLDQLRLIIDSNISTDTSPLRWHYFEQIAGRPAATGDANAYLMANPTMRFTPIVGIPALAALRARYTLHNFIPTRAQLTPLLTNTTGLTISGVLGFFSENTYLPWFSQVSTIMSFYSRFFKSSRSMSSLIVTGLGAGIIISTPSPFHNYFIDAPNAEAAVASNAVVADPANNVVGVADTASAAAYYRAVPPTSLLVTAQHSDRNCEEVAEQYGLLTCMNVSSTGSLGNNLPTDATIRVGTSWSLPILRRVDNVNVIHGFGPNIQANYILARPQ